jgi:hypothetical protein
VLENAGLTTFDSTFGSLPTSPSISISTISGILSLRLFLPSILNSIGTDLTPSISPIRGTNSAKKIAASLTGKYLG